MYSFKAFEVESLFRGIFPKTHWNDLLNYLEANGPEIVEIELNHDGVVVDHSLVSFISELDEDVVLLVEKDKLMTTRTNGLVEIKYHSNDAILIEDETNRQGWIIDLIRPIYLH